MSYPVSLFALLQKNRIQMLQECLIHCKSIGLNKVLLTCEENNIGSKKTILKNGGIYEKTVFCESDDVNLERYWIEL